MHGYRFRRGLLAGLRAAGHRAVGLAPLVVAMATTACGGSARSALEQKLASLQDELVTLQNSQDRLSDRVMVLENRAPLSTRPSSAGARPLERQPLKVVKMAPPETPSTPSPVPNPGINPEAEEPRLLIQGSGDDLETLTLEASALPVDPAKKARVGATPARRAPAPARVPAPNAPDPSATQPAGASRSRADTPGEPAGAVPAGSPVTGRGS